MLTEKDAEAHRQKIIREYSSRSDQVRVRPLPAMQVDGKHCVKAVTIKEHALVITTTSCVIKIDGFNEQGFDILDVLSEELDKFKKE